MIRKIIFSLFVLFFFSGFCQAQISGKISDLFPEGRDRSGRLAIIQDPGIDSIIFRHILYNRNNGPEGFRIQIYSSSARNAREESARIRALFISSFPDIPSYFKFDAPGYYKIRVGDFRTRTEGTKYLMMIRKEFSNAHFVPDIINFPDKTN